MLDYIVEGPIGYFVAPELAAYPFVRHGFLTKRGGLADGPFSGLNVSSRLGNRDCVRQNWELLATALRIPLSRFVLARQVHGNKVLVVDGDARVAAAGENGEFDALITDRPGLALAIRTADCVPVFLLDPCRRVIGVAHAGWRGTVANIVGAVVDRMKRRYGSRPGDLLAAVGPSIGACCYRVDRPVYEAVHSERHRSAWFRKNGAGNWLFDLPLANRMQLVEAGVPEEGIVTAETCTGCRADLFFSHRRDGADTGRQLNFMILG
ncbi:MAG: Laccase domain protein YfiH [Syntrophaceae bacterium PtaU1.Bin231]|nr:MAG: Laccase domain protein YfiH [Syntrophaceae bacterium PtaU1.Bin231]HOG17798.1 peptidoglycan editing factor PgeF [Syntrophales bacterium]